MRHLQQRLTRDHVEIRRDLIHQQEGRGAKQLEKQLAAVRINPQHLATMHTIMTLYRSAHEVCARAPESFPSLASL